MRSLIGRGSCALVHGVRKRCTITISTSAISASAIASRLAATNSVLAPVWIALKIGAPSPSGVMNAAMVASEIVVTVATRTPAMIAGTASGSSTRVSDWRRVRPMPSAASLASSRHLLEPGQRVAEQDQQRVGDQRDLDGQPADAR